MGRGVTDACINHCENALRSSTDNDVLYFANYYAGIAYQEKALFDVDDQLFFWYCKKSAITYFTKAIELAPPKSLRQAAAYRYRARVSISIASFDEALGDCEAALACQLNPDLTYDIYATRCRVYVHKNNHAASIGDLNFLSQSLQLINQNAAPNHKYPHERPNYEGLIFMVFELASWDFCQLILTHECSQLLREKAKKNLPSFTSFREDRNRKKFFNPTIDLLNLPSYFIRSRAEKGFEPIDELITFFLGLVDHPEIIALRQLASQVGITEKIANIMLTEVYKQKMDKVLKANIICKLNQHRLNKHVEVFFSIAVNAAIGEPEEVKKQLSNSLRLQGVRSG